MSKNKIINIVAVTLVIAIVAGITTTFLIKHKNDEKNNISAEKVTSFSIIGNAGSENTHEHTQTVPNQGGKHENEDITSTGETLTDKHGNTVSKPTDKQPITPSKPGPSSNNTTNFTPNTPLTNDNVSQSASAFGFTWDPVNGVFYSTSDPWQRQFGYNKYYDIFGGYIALYFDTVRIKFNYGGYDWLVQFWKGQYGFLLLGAEAGVYYKDENDPGSQYICTDNNKRLKIGYTCYYKGDVLFERAYQDTWWLTGFVPGRLDKFADRSPLKMKIRITLKDEEMRDAFVSALKQPGVGFTQGNGTAPDTFYTSGNDVYLMWQTDRSKTS